MKKKFLIVLVGCMLAVSLAGCGESTSVNVNVENSGNLNGTKLGKDALIEIGNELWYDSTTRIVYWWNGVLSNSYYAVAPSPYYAPNGLPYRYNPETNTFEEIEK